MANNKLERPQTSPHTNPYSRMVPLFLVVGAIPAVYFGGLSVENRTHKLEELRRTQYTQQFVPPSSYTLLEHPVDQVFRDHNGYRALWTDGTGQIRERHYLNYADIYYTVSIPFPDIPEIDSFTGLRNKGEHIKIYKDVESGRGYAQGVEFEVESEDPLLEGRALQYLEIHLPLEARLSPGTEVYGDFKSRVHDTMSELQ